MVSNASASSSGGRISFGGLASGLDTNAIIDALVQIEQRPILQQQSKLAAQQRRQAALQTVNSSIASLASAAANLKNSTIVGAKSATTDQLSSVAPYINVSASSAAAASTFTVDVLSLATNTSVRSAAAVGTAVTQGAALADAGFTLAVTTGTFSVNGTSFTIDETTVLSDGTDLVGANTILAKINNAGIGVTASITNDADGRANLLQLTSASTIQLGQGSDTSNFLSAANLLQSPGTTTRTSTRPMAGVATGEELSAARFTTALSDSSGSFAVNGVTISWDAAVDSLTNVISRINSAGAGVTATFDVATDRLVLTQDATGSTKITLSDTTGNFLAATGVLAATQTLGGNASYQIDGGSTQYSTSNTVTDAVTGVTLTLLQETVSAVTVTVAADNTALRNQLQSFVTQYNSTMSVLANNSKYSESGENGPLFGDPMITRVQQALRSLITSTATGIEGDLSTLSALGLNFGAVGSAVGTTSTLALNQATFNSVMASNPEGVARLLSAFSATAALEAGGTGSIASISGVPTAATDSGTYTITSTAAGVLTVTFQADNGGPLVVSSGTLTAGGTNTTIIPGVTITAKGVLVAGADTITITATEEGVGKSIAEYLTSLTTSGGVLEASQESASATISDINDQITKLNAQVEAKRAQLQAKFTALEMTMQKLQGQQSQLTQLQNALGFGSSKK